ncbi:MAG: MarR family winged helix-turn-helix transcriptional regulator [Candidatus Nanopelagicales bacterium]
MRPTEPLIVDLLQDTLRQLSRVVTAELAVADLTLDQWRVLRALDESSGRTMGELADTSQLTPATATRTVDALVDRGLAYRHAPASDRRQVVVVLATAGEHLCLRLDAVVRDSEERALRRLGLNSSQALRELLNTARERATATA